MKQTKNLFFMSLIGISTLAATVLCAPKFGSPKIVDADGGNVSIAKVNDGNWNPFGWGTHGVNNNGLTDLVAPDNQANLWSSDFIDLSKHDNCDLEFSFDSYDSTEVKLGNWTDGLDFYINSDDNSTTYCILRIWTTGWGAKNGNHPTRMYGNNWETFADNDDDFNQIDAEGHTKNILGDACSNSSFNIRLNKTYGLAFKNVWGGWSYCARTDISSPLLTAISQGQKLSIVIGADGGFARNTLITLKSFNGQSFANDGVNFVDNLGPEVITSSGGDMARYTPLGNIGCTAWDTFSGDCSITNKKADDVEFQNPDVYFNSNGSHKLSFTSVDSFGNSSTRDAMYNVVDPTASSFAAWMMCEHASDYSCASKYADAKTMFKGLGVEERTVFATDDSCHDGCERYVAWCFANGDYNPFNGSDPVQRFENLPSTNIISQDSSILLSIIVAVSFLCLAALYFTLIIKKRKHK